MLLALVHQSQHHHSKRLLGNLARSYATLNANVELDPPPHVPRSSTSTSSATSKTFPSDTKTLRKISNPPETQAARNTNLASDSALLFSSLEGKVHRCTLDAITNGPYRYDVMSEVQSKILPGLPQLIGHGNEVEPQKQSPGTDLLVKAKTGTGKTLAFLVPAIEKRVRDLEAFRRRVHPEVAAGGAMTEQTLARMEREYASLNPGVLVISPTRELATQIAVEAQNLSLKHASRSGRGSRMEGKGGFGFGVVCLLGGESRLRQIRDWVGDTKQKTQREWFGRFGRNDGSGFGVGGPMGVRKDVVVATPGRLLDLLKSEQGVREVMQKCRMVVLDEADTLLDMGFRSDIEEILSYLPRVEERLTWMFSATITRGVESIVRDSLRRGYEFFDCVGDETPVHQHIPQFHTVLPSGQEAMRHLIRVLAHDQLLARKEGKKSKVVVFLSTTKMVEMVADMVRMVIDAEVLPCGRRTGVFEMHSRKDMQRRVRTSKMFREGNQRDEASVLITSDVSARGVDYPGVTRVVQLGLPASKEMYVHRVGRTGRGSNKEGRGDLVIAPWEMGFLRKCMGDVGMEPVTVEGMKNDTEELAKEVVNDGGAYVGRLGKLNAVVDSVCTSVDRTVYSEVFGSHLGFYLGHADNLGLRIRDVIDGLGRYLMEMGGLPGVPALSRGMAERVQMAVGGAERRVSRWGGYNKEKRVGERMWESKGSGIRGDYQENRNFKVKREQPHWAARGSGKAKRSSRGGW